MKVRHTKWFIPFLPGNTCNWTIPFNDRFHVDEPLLIYQLLDPGITCGIHLYKSYCLKKINHMVPLW